MVGKTVAITNCTSGTGLVLARTCGVLGAKVVMLNRPSERANSALLALQQQRIEALWVPCDLQSIASVRSAATQLLQFCAANGIYIICNNTGILGEAV
jgi:NAD(P)-dependent dehydrogenase (short-subunit alcohol dehydrogenase family)